MEIYDFCAYPQCSGFFSFLNMTKAISIADDFKKPDRSEEAQICIDAYLGNELLNLLNGQITSNDEFLSTYRKVASVFQSLKKSKIVNITNGNEKQLCAEMFDKVCN